MGERGVRCEETRGLLAPRERRHRGRADRTGGAGQRSRVYDPTVGRFLSVDPIVRDIAASQSWNGYGYVEGRMLSWTDPSGYSACPGRMSGDSCDIKPEESWKRERMLSRDSYRAIGGHWVGDNSPAWRFDIGVEGIGVAAHSPIWVSTGFSWGMLGQAAVGNSAGMHDMPSQMANEAAEAAAPKKNVDTTFEEVMVDAIRKHKKCLAETYGSAFDFAYDLSPFAVVGTIAESAVTEVTEDMLARQANRNKYAGAGRRLGAVGSRQMRTLVQFRYFNAGMTVAGAAATGVVIGANVFCGYSGL